MTYPQSTADKLIAPVAPLGFTALGKAHAATFVLPMEDQNADGNFTKHGITEDEWRQACTDLDAAFHKGELPLAMGILQWVPLVVLAGPVWINMRAEQKQRRAVFLALAKLQKTLFRPKNLLVQLHSDLIHRGRSGEQYCWLSIASSDGSSSKDKPTLVFTSNDAGKDKTYIANLLALYKACEEKV